MLKSLLDKRNVATKPLLQMHLLGMEEKVCLAQKLK